MTFLVIILTLSIGAIYYLTTGNVVEIAGFRIYVLAMICGLAVAVTFALIKGDKRAKLGAFVLGTNFLATHIAWGTSDPVIIHAIADIATAGYFILVGQTRWEIAIGWLFAASALVGAATAFNWIPDSTERPAGFFAFAFPDLVAVAGHAANIALGFGAGDSGARVRSLFRTQSRIALVRHQAFVALRRRSDQS